MTLLALIFVLFSGWWFFIYLFFVILVGVAANSRGRSAIGWMILALFTTPILSGFFLMVMGDNKPERPDPIDLDRELKNKRYEHQFGRYVTTLNHLILPKQTHYITINGRKEFFNKRSDALIHLAYLEEQKEITPNKSISDSPLSTLHSNI